MLDTIELGLPRDTNGWLHSEIVGRMQEEPWCDFDVGALELDHALWSSWEAFCETVKHKRRFFFHATGRDDQDSLTPASLLKSIATASEELGLIAEFPVGLELWRARSDLSKGRRVGPSDFGPPPVEYALQSNRMNPAGIPMLYLASTKTTALKETRSTSAKLGLWRAARPLRILDLRSLPPVPGMFSDATRSSALTLRFLHDFADDIMRPVDRSTHVDINYLPSQVVTEFMRDHAFEGGQLDGIAYGSTVSSRGWNVALFMGQIEMGLEIPPMGPVPSPVFTFVKSLWATCLSISTRK